MLGESIHQLQWDGMVSLMVQLVVLKLPAASMEMCPPKGHGSRGSFMPAQGLWSILVLDKIIWDETCFTQSNLLTIHLHEHFFWFLLICPSLSKMTNHLQWGLVGDGINHLAALAVRWSSCGKVLISDDQWTWKMMKMNEPGKIPQLRVFLLWWSRN